MFFLDFYGVGDARFYLYLSPLFLFRLLTGQALARGRGRQNFKADPRQGGLFGDARKIRRARVQKALWSGKKSNEKKGKKGGF